MEINGTYDADPAEIEAVLREHGVYVGAPKKGIDDLSEIKNDAVHRIDGINWAWLYIEGAKARFEVQEITPAPEVADLETPTDIIAACDGVVRSAVVKRGERHVNSNMTVTAGQKLVSGKVADVYKRQRKHRGKYHCRKRYIEYQLCELFCEIIVNDLCFVNKVSHKYYYKKLHHACYKCFYIHFDSDPFRAS